MKFKLVTLASPALVVLAAVSAFAHHGTNLYDMTKPIIVKGTITQFEWGNPHNQIYFDAKDDKGNVAHWVVATEPPAVMSEKGWTRKTLKPGDQVTTYVFPAKNGAPVGNLQKIILPDGTELAATGPPGVTPPK